MVRRVWLFGLLTLCLSGCPLPFQYTREGYTNHSAATDPSTPSITAAPVVRYSASSGSGTVPNLQSAETNGDTAITLSSDTVGSVIYYTTNGTTPDPRSSTTSKYGSAFTLSVSNPTVDTARASLTVMATAIGPNMKPSSITTATVTVQYPQAAAPTFSVAGGWYDADQAVVLSCATPGATIYYTMVSGSGPAPRPVPGQGGTTQYASPISVTGPANTWVISAIAVKSQMIDSITASASYSVSYPGLGIPSFNPPPGVRNNDTTVTLASDAGSTIWYTTDGSDPTVGASPSLPSGSTLTFSGGAGGVVMLKARASKAGMVDSGIAAGRYDFKVADPVPSASGGTYYNPVTVTLSTVTNLAQIYYTTNGSTPTTGSTQYTGPISVTSSVTIKSIAIRNTYQPSEIRIDQYILQCAPTNFSAGGGTYPGPFSVSLSNATVGATIHCTVDGSTPTAASPGYIVPIPLMNGTSTTVKALATAPGMADSMITTATYVIATPPSKPLVGTATPYTMVVTVPAIASSGNYVYHLYRDYSPSFPSPTLVASGTSINVTDSGLMSSMTYYYYVVLVYTDILVSFGSWSSSGMTLNDIGLPEVASVTIPGAYATPSGYSPVFYLTATTFDTTTTAALALRQGGYTFIPYGKRDDNGSTVCIRVFDSQSVLYKDVFLTGARYIWSVSVDQLSGIITWTGQSGGTVSIYWPNLMVQ